jgi:hypothetical protein
MTARFQGYDEGSAAGLLPGFYKCMNLGVRSTVFLVPSLSHQFAHWIQNDSPDHRVGFDVSPTTSGQRKGFSHPGFEIVHGRLTGIEGKNRILREPSHWLCVYVVYGEQRTTICRTTIHEIPPNIPISP